MNIRKKKGKWHNYEFGLQIRRILPLTYRGVSMPIQAQECLPGFMGNDPSRRQKKVFVDGAGQPLKPEPDANTFMEKEYPSIWQQLDRNGGVYFSSKGLYENPFALLEMVRENRYTLKSPRLEVAGWNEDFAHSYIFRGDICEVTYSFYFRIFSPAFAARVRDRALDRPIYPHEDFKLLTPVLNPCPECGGVESKVRSPSGFALWSVVCKCGHKGPVRQNDDLAAFAWNDGLTE